MESNEHWVTTWNAGVADDLVRDRPGPKHAVTTAGVLHDFTFDAANRYARADGAWREITPRLYITLELLGALVGSTKAAQVVDGDTVVSWANAYWIGPRPEFDQVAS